jgi:molybdate transport system substrate-binding protein
MEEVVLEGGTSRRGAVAVLAFTCMLLLTAASPARAGEALAAVAANFAEVMDELVPMFEQRSGHRLAATTGSTGKLYAQVAAGAPFQVLLSADAKTPERLESEGLAVAGTRFTYAIGRLALWSSDADRVGADGRSALAASDLRHIAIANPDLAPYGWAAREALQNLGLWGALQSKVVVGENIGQTHSLVATGNAQLGLIALSAVLSPRAASRGSHWVVPQDLFTPIRQDAILLRPGADNAAARAFLDFLKSPEARQVIERYGYAVE